MKPLAIFGFILFLTHAYADDIELLKQCQVSCNSTCRSLALKLKPLIETAEGCTGASEVTRRCDYHFSGTFAQVCAARASSVEVINRCYYHFGNTDKAVTCVSGSKVEVINRCYYHFGNSDRGAECAGAGKSVDHINSCVRTHGTGQAGLICVAGQ